MTSCVPIIDFYGANLVTIRESAAYSGPEHISYPPEPFIESNSLTKSKYSLKSCLNRDDIRGMRGDLLRRGPVKSSPSSRAELLSNSVEMCPKSRDLLAGQNIYP